MRDEFSEKVKDILGKRVNLLCSNPNCRKPTSGPRTEPDKIMNIGVAAHITAASYNGCRYNAELTQEERKSANNGIWLCQNCAKLIDNDVIRYSEELLRKWKSKAEKSALSQLELTHSSKSNWKNSLTKQLTTFSRVEFYIPYVSPGDGVENPERIIAITTRLIFDMISCVYQDTSKLINRDNFVFALTIRVDRKDNLFNCSGELVTHLTPFAYHFGVLSELLNNGKIDELVDLMDSYPKIKLQGNFKCGTLSPFKISRINPAKIFIEFIEDSTYKFKQNLTTSDLILYFTFGANGRVLIFDDQNKKKTYKEKFKINR